VKALTVRQKKLQESKLKLTKQAVDLGGLLAVQREWECVNTFIPPLRQPTLTPPSKPMTVYMVRLLPLSVPARPQL